MKYFLLGILMLLCSCGQQPEFRSQKRKMRKVVGSAVVRITGKTPSGRSSGGTGFVVKAPSGRLYIVTNKHVCGLRNSENKVTVEFPGFERTYDKKVIETSKKHDLCLVESIPAFKKHIQVADKVEFGDGIFVVGHPKLFALTVTEGEIIEDATIRVLVSKSRTQKPVVVNNPRKIQSGSFPSIKTFKTNRFHVYSRGGNSGSPIVNFDGKLVSVLFAGNRQDSQETYGVPLKYVKNFLKGY